MMKTIITLGLILFTTSLYSQTRKFEKKVVKETCKCIDNLPDSLNLSPERKIDTCFPATFANEMEKNDNSMPYLGINAIDEGIRRMKIELFKNCNALKEKH